MPAELDRANPFYEGRVPVRVEREGGGAVEEMLTLRVLPGVKKTSAQQRVGLMHMEITRDEDPYFLYTLQVSEEEFHDLKTEQSLLVDFASFPPKFVELVEDCIAAHKSTTEALITTDGKPGSTTRIGSSGNGRFLAVLDLSGLPTLKLVEANQFKQLTHLALRFQPASDSMLKTYLAGRLKLCQSRNDFLQAKLGQTKEALELQNAETERQSARASELAEKLEVITNELDEKHAGNLSKQKEESLKLLAQTQNAASEQARKQQEQSDKRIQELEAQLSSLQKDYRSAYEGKAALEADNKQMRAKLETLDKLSADGHAELAQLRTENRELDAERFALEKKISELQLSLVALEQRLVDKEEILAKTSATLEDHDQRRATLEEKTAHYKSIASKLQRKLEIGIKEINKGNQVIEDLQMELSGAKDKIKTKNLVIRQQEKALDEKSNELDDSSNALERMRDQIQAEKARSEELRKALDQSKEKLAECNKMLESNQNVIAFLNKEINQSSSNGARYASPMPATSSAYHATSVHLSPDNLKDKYTLGFERRTADMHSSPPFEHAKDIFPSPPRNTDSENAGDLSNLTLNERHGASFQQIPSS